MLHHTSMNRTKTAWSKSENAKNRIVIEAIEELSIVESIKAHQWKHYTKFSKEISCNWWFAENFL